MSCCKSLAVALAVATFALSGYVHAANPAAVDPKEYERVVTSAIDFLKSSQSADGSFSPQAGPGVTALVVAGVLRTGRSPDEPWIQKGLKYLEAMVQKDGGLNKEDTLYRNYETCLALVAFKAANKDGRYTALIKQCNGYVLSTQWDESTMKEKDDPFYGGAGYGKSKRPDLSNTAFMVDVLKELGGEENDAAIQRALVFVSRCQNLETEHNTTPHAAKVNDGGFYYTPAAGGSSQAGTTENGGLRSYASMTYAGLKSMLYANLKPDDPRVKAAKTWIAKHYDLKSNPGLDDNGLYYYYHTFAKCLDALGSETFTDAEGTVHVWRAELFAELASRQNADGSWVNKNSRWLEGDVNLVTGYALMALEYCKPGPQK